jgi:hypothetical protein
MMSDQEKQEKPKIDMPTAEALQRELPSTKSIDDFFGCDGIFARLLSKRLERMLEAELTAQLGSHVRLSCTTRREDRREQDVPN